MTLGQWAQEASVVDFCPRPDCSALAVCACALLCLMGLLQITERVALV